MSENRRSSRSIKPSEEALKKFERARINKNFDYEELTDAAGLKDVTQVKRFFNPRLRRPVQRKTIACIARALELNPLEIFPDWLGLVESLPSLPPTEDLNQWRLWCARSLQNRLTTNPLTAKDEVRFNVEDVYVPLGLIDMNRGLLATQTSEEVDKDLKGFYSNEQFYKQVLIERSTLLSAGERLAIVGEPGSGKSTMLQTISTWLLENEQGYPICISLPELQGESLEEHVRGNWLNEAELCLESSNNQTECLNRLLESGKAWLLLDGLDEISAKPAEAKANLAKSLKGWLGQARVIITCRSNTWYAGANALEEFDTFQIQQFTYPEGIFNFIDRWFAGETHFADSLKHELVQWREFIRLPLWLALTCLAWKRNPKQNLSTSNSLFAEFVDSYYDWKTHSSPPLPIEKTQLNKALGRLALLAMKEKQYQFSRKALENVLNDGQGDNLLDRLLNLGWLKHVRASEELTGQEYFAFFHGTFQEYFASQAIEAEQWAEYFFHHVPDDPSGPGACYNCLERHWEQRWQRVALLWFGRKDVSDKQKNQFVQALLDFSSESNWYHNDSALFLAAQATRKYNCRLEEDIAWSAAKLVYMDCLRKKIIWLGSYSWTYSSRGSELMSTLESIKPWAVFKTYMRIIKESNRIVVPKFAQLAERDQQIIPHLIGFLDQHQHSKHTRLNAIVALQTIICEGQVTEALQKSALRDEDAEVRLAAQNILDQIQQEVTSKTAKASNSRNTSMLAGSLEPEPQTEQNQEDSDWWMLDAFRENDTHSAMWLINPLCSRNIDVQIEAREALSTAQNKDNTDLIHVLRILMRSETASWLTKSNAAIALGNIVWGDTEALLCILEQIKINMKSDDIHVVTYGLGSVIEESTYPIFFAWCRHLLDQAIAQGDTFIESFVSELCYEYSEHLEYVQFAQAWIAGQSTPHSEASKSMQPNAHSELPNCLNEVLAKTGLRGKVKIVWIDTNKFIDPSNPAAKIYTTLVRAGCSPWIGNSVPQSMTMLQAYWDLMETDTDKRVVMILYNSLQTDELVTREVLLALSKFERSERSICIVSNSHRIETEGLQSFSSRRLDLPDKIMQWIKAWNP